MEEKNQIFDFEPERLALACRRIREIGSEDTVAEPYRTFFYTITEFLLTDGILNTIESGEDSQTFISRHSADELAKLNRQYYSYILPENYEESFWNPDYACKVLGEFGQPLSLLATEILSMIGYAREGRQFEALIFLELFLEIYGMFSDAELPKAESVKQVLHDFYYDYADQLVPYRIKEMFDPRISYLTDLVRKSDLSDLRYLYCYGDYISENEIGIAKYLHSLPQEKIDALAFTYTDGYREGFELAGIDLSKKKYVNLHYAIGQERMVLAAIRQFEEMGLTPIIYRPALSLINRRNGRRSGVVGTSANRQYDFDHRFDDALYFDADFLDRKLKELKNGYENIKEYAKLYAGPAVIETFGEDPFDPQQKENALSYNQKQQKLSVEYTDKASAIANTYVNRAEYSFTIIAYPIPEIGENFTEIFDEIVKVNTLDKKKYRKIQESLIEELDKAKSVLVRGKDKNRTDIRVMMHERQNPETETNFENCLADVNIPLGEVFTSPKLTGTEGVLNVSEVYLNGLKYIDLELTFKDGKIASYTCKNFATEEENKKYIRDNLLQNRETLPIGEFAIGTNTTAYVMANRYGIVYKLPILIVEKMGPHFAVGDTCYSYSEENRVYNPDGKEIVAKDNEISILRKEDPAKAYFNCHTDITIPYDEIGSIVSVHADGTEVKLIENGRFVLPGTEGLNEPFSAQA